MKYLAIIGALAFSMTISAQQKPAYLMDGLSNLHHPVSTENAEAQKFFDQGLRLVYAFNHEEAARSFHRAAELDPKLAMAWWGVALAVGPNYNLPVDPEHEKLAVEAIEKAHALASSASPIEQAYIDAMAKRFSADPKPDYHQLDINYSRAMADLTHRYPDDLDAATLYADSLMNLRPWQLWNHDGTPAEGTTEIVSTLEGVLRREPNHIGAMHLYIHAVEASPNPERALPYADRIPALAPAAGHLVHMPAHIYERTGNFDGARAQNVAAARADEAYAAASGSQGMYMMMYYSHNLHFGAVSASMQGRCAEAKSQADRLPTIFAPWRVTKTWPRWWSHLLACNMPSPRAAAAGTISSPLPNHRRRPTRLKPTGSTAAVSPTSRAESSPKLKPCTSNSPQSSTQHRRMSYSCRRSPIIPPRFTR